MMKTSEMKTSKFVRRSSESPIGLYIHIPFCKSKCSYCDFVSYPIDDSDTHLAYILKVIYELRAKRALLSGGAENRITSGEEAVSNESVRLIGPGAFGVYDAPLVDTVYIGGGTPSLIEEGFITELLDAVYSSYKVTEGAEITIEVNPGTADTEKFRRYRAAGVTRVSIGAQSFDKSILRFLGRIHTASDIGRSVEYARRAGFDDISLDLIFGIPGQTLSGWVGDLTAAASLMPSHLSFYSLQIEESTPFHNRLALGEFEEIDEALDRRMYHTAKEYLSEHGLFQYEISNSAMPGFESLHNLKYWSMEPYAGFGVGAHSYFGGRRFSNTSCLTTYLTAEDTSEMTDCIHENTLSDDMSEFVFLGLRRISGIELSRFKAIFGKDFWELYGDETKNLIGRGLLEHSGDKLRLTPLGLDLANSVFSEFV